MSEQEPFNIDVTVSNLTDTDWFNVYQAEEFYDDSINPIIVAEGTPSIHEQTVFDSGYIYAPYIPFNVTGSFTLGDYEQHIDLTEENEDDLYLERMGYNG